MFQASRARRALAHLRQTNVDPPEQCAAQRQWRITRAHKILLACATFLLLGSAGFVVVTSSSSSPEAAATSTTTVPPQVVVAPVRVGAVDGAESGEAAVGEIVTAIEQLVNVATAEALTVGGPVDLDGVLTTRAREALDEERRHVLTDESLPPVDVIVIDAVDIDLSFLGVGDGHELVVVDLTMAARAGGPLTPDLRLSRTAELIMVPSEGVWLVDAFDIEVRRDSSAVPSLGDWLWPWSV